MRVGAFLGPYRLLEELGSGATGTVFLADQPGAEGPASRTVALKLFHAHLSSYAGFVARFEREAEAGRRVVHENVVRVLDAEMMVVEGEVRFFLVMEHVSGRTLRRVLGELGPLPEPLLREIALEAARGLAAVHGAGLVHRDVKPDNLILTDDGRVRLMDLGVARVVDASRALTGTGNFVGTLLYAAPEVLGGASATAAADVYGLGVTLYELAAGRNPFLRDATAAVVQAQLGFVPAALRAARPELSSFLDTLVNAMLLKRMDERFPTATALLEVLEAGERSPWWGERAAGVEVEDRRRAGRPFLALDANGDGTDDVVVLGLGAGPGIASRFQVFLGGGGGLGTSATQTGDLVPGLPAITLEPRGAVGDLDGDLDDDVVLTFKDNTLSPVHTLRNNGDGTFTTGFLQLQPSLFSGPPILVTPLQADAGATLDLAVVMRPHSTGGPYKLGFSLGSGAGVFAEIGDRLTLPREPSSIGVSDVNGDGMPDLVFFVRTVGPEDVLTAYLGNGDRTFDPSTLSVPLASTLVGTGPLTGALGDIDGDGQLDIVFTDAGAGPGAYVLRVVRHQ